MKKTYKKFITAFVFTLAFQTLSKAQCYNSLPGATAVVTTSTPGTFVNVTNCNTAGEYNDITFSVPGVFSFITSIPTDYITITDNFNNPIAAGFTPLYSVTIPSAGLYYFHISANGSCGFDPSCRVSDIFVLSPCSGLPSAGTVPTSFSICPNTSALINVTGATAGPGISYQWQEAPTAGGPWTNVTSGSGFNSINFASAPLSTLTYYQFVVTCAISALSATSTVFSVNPNNPFTLCYCSAGLSGGGCSDFITNVTIPTTPFNNTSACSINSSGDTYSFFNPAAGTTATLTAGGSNSISITTNFNNIISVWIDYDQSGTFDASEHTQVCLTSVAGVPNIAVINIPVSALTGQTGLRVRSSFSGNPNGPNDACSFFWSGECEDYVITINPAVPCSGLPIAGTVPASFSVCPNTSAFINVTGATVGSGISYQWEEAPTSLGPWANVTSGSGFNSPNFATTPLSTQTFYRFVVTCATSALSATSAVVSVNINNPVLCYCISGLGGSGCGDFITNVTIPTTPLNNTSACNTNVFGDTYSLFNPGAGTTATLVAGGSYSISITTNNNNIISVWIDFDQSGTFDASEHTQVCFTSFGAANTTVITVPATALTGQTGLRIRSRGAGNPNGPNDACSGFGSGETEDYVITINPAVPCSGTPASNSVVATSTLICTGSTSNLNLLNTYTVVGLTYQWASAPTSGGPYTAISGATLNTYALSSLSSTTWFRCVITCPSGPASTTATPVQISALGAPVYASVPFLENFDNTWQDRCDLRNVPVAANWDSNPTTGNTSWRRQDDGASANWTTPFFNVAPLAGAGAANFHSFDTYATTGNLDLYVNLGGTSSYDLSFYHINSDGDDSLQVLLSTDGGVSFTPKITYLSGSYPPFDPNWNKKTINLGVVNSTSCVVRFLATSDYGTSDIGIDSLEIKVLPPCTGAPAANTVVATSICSGGFATLGLATTYTSSGLTYQWASATASVGPYTAISGATLNTYSLPVPGTTKWYRCVITCLSGPASTTATPVQISALGAPVYASVPFLENFDNTWQDRCDTRNVPVAANWDSSPTTGDNSWRRQDDGTSANWLNPFFNVTPLAGAGAANFHTYDTYAATGNLDLYVNLGGTLSYDLSFYHINGDGDDSLQVLLSTDGGVSFTPKITYLSGSYPPFDPNWNKKTINLGVVNSTSCVVRFLATSDYGTSDIGIDSLEIKVLPPCIGVPAANTVVATSTAVCSGGTTTLSLATAYTSSGLTYQWASATSSVGPYAAISGATLSTYSPASLSSTTWFRCVITCPSGPASTTATPVQISALGAPVYASVPFLENFDNTWQNRCDTRNVPVAANWDSNPRTGDNSWRRQDDGASAGWTGGGFFAVTPFNGAGSADFQTNPTNLASGSLDLYVNMGSTLNYLLSFFHVNVEGNDSLQVLLSTDGGATFTPKVTYLSGSYSPIDANWNEKVFNLGAVNSTSCVLRFLATSDLGASDIGMDSLKIITLPNCTGAPAANTVVATSAAVCPGGTAYLSFANSYTTSGLGYQWASATSSVGPYTSIPGASLSTYAATGITSNVWFRCVVTCTSGPASTTLTPIEVSSTPFYASVPFLENFDNFWQDRCGVRDVPSSLYWDSNPSTGNNSWRRQDEGGFAGWSTAFGMVTPLSGAGAADFNNYDCSPGDNGILDLYVNLSGTSSYDLSFYHVNADGNDQLITLLSTDGGLSFTTLNAYFSGNFSPIDANWNKKIINLGVVNSASCVIRFFASADGGNSDIGIDSLEVTVGCSGPQPNTVWTGGAGTTDWFDNNNWSNCAPGLITDATIPAGGIVLISSSNADVKNLSISSGALLQISSTETINVSGDWSNDGTFNANNGLVNFAGSVPQQINGTSNTSFYNLLIGQNVYLVSNSTDVQNILTINAGITFDLNNSNLSILGSIANTTGEFKGDNVATLSLYGTGNMGTLRFALGFEKLAGLNISIGNAGIIPGVIVLGSNLVIDALNPSPTLNLVNGGINLNGYNLSSSPTTYYYGGPTSIVYGHPNSILDIESNITSGNLNMDATANSLKALILNSWGTLILGSQLSILDSVKVSGGGTLATNNFLTLKSTANLKARIADCSGGTILGNVTVETFAPGGITDWSVLGVSGVHGQTFNDWYGQIPLTIEGSATGVTSAGGVYFESVQGWDESDAYGYDTTIAVTSPITPGKGYWTYLGNNAGTTGDLIWSVTGSPVFGNFSYPVLGSGIQSGYNLVSNPYASPISWAKVLAASSGINDAIYIYNPDLGLTTSYVFGVSVPPTNGANDVIPMGQGFYIQSSGGTALNFSETCKVPNNTNANPLLRSSNSVDPAIGTLLHLKVEGEGYSDYTAIRFHSNASTSFDTKLDAHKLYDSPGYAGFPGTWTKRTVIATQTEGVDYSVNSLPYATIQNAVIPVIVRVYTTGQYTISSSDFANLQADGNACVVLKDKLTNIFHDLTTGDYVFSINDTTQAARFELTVCAKESVTTSTLTTGIKPNSGSLANAVFISKDTRGIFANLNFNKPTNTIISVTNVLGQKIIDSKKVRVTNETVYLDLDTSDQLIFVTIETETEKVTKKFLNSN